MNNQYINIPEDGLEIAHTIYDKFGDVYTVSGHLSSWGLLSYVVSPTKCVGRINWDTSKPGLMIIADLIIFEPLNIKPWWGRLFPFFYRPPAHYKGRGLGSAMLNYIIASAQAMDIAEIRGWITGSDLEATPYLPAFYRKHGFTVDDESLTLHKVLA